MCVLHLLKVDRVFEIVNKFEIQRLGLPGQASLLNVLVPVSLSPYASVISPSHAMSLAQTTVSGQPYHEKGSVSPQKLV